VSLSGNRLKALGEHGLHGSRVSLEALTRAYALTVKRVREFFGWADCPPLPPPSAGRCDAKIKKLGKFPCRRPTRGSRFPQDMTETRRQKPLGYARVSTYEQMVDVQLEEPLTSRSDTDQKAFTGGMAVPSKCRT
jgi:hypothetical protein